MAHDTTARTAFDEFDAFHAAWNATANPAATMLDEAVALGERLVAETEATGQGSEFRLIAALAHIGEVSEFSNRPDEDLVDAADDLVFQMNAVVNG